MRNGRYTMLLIAEFISSMKADISCRDFCHQITARIDDVYEESGISIERLKEHPEERLTASVVLFSNRRKEVWMVGDCQCIVNCELITNGKPSEQATAEKRSRYIKELLSEGRHIADLQVNDEGRSIIYQDLIASCQRQNIDFAVIDGFPIPPSKVKIIPAEGEIVLASDGYPFLKSSLRESEEALAKQLKDDPLCINSYKATKGLMLGNQSFDDRAYIRFTS